MYTYIAIASTAYICVYSYLLHTMYMYIHVLYMCIVTRVGRLLGLCWDGGCQTNSQRSLVPTANLRPRNCSEL